MRRVLIIVQLLLIVIALSVIAYETFVSPKNSGVTQETSTKKIMPVDQYIPLEPIDPETNEQEPGGQESTDLGPIDPDHAAYINSLTPDDHYVPRVLGMAALSSTPYNLDTLTLELSEMIDFKT